MYELIFFPLLLMISNGLLGLPHGEPGAWVSSSPIHFFLQSTFTESTLVPGTEITKRGGLTPP